MSIKKEIVVLTGGGHKGIVKMQTSARNTVEGYCNLDYRPVGAVLYLVGDNIAEIVLKDINTPFEVAFSANNEFACMIRSTSVTMFGGSIPKHETMLRVDEYIRRKNADKNKNSTATNTTKVNVSNAKQNRVEVESADKIEYVNGDVVGGERVADECCERTARGDGNEHQNNEGVGGTSCGINTSRDNSISSNEGVLSGDNSSDCDESETKVKTQYGYKGSGGTLPSMKDLEEWVKYDGNNFYYAVKPQLDEMFICYPEDETLNENVQNSKWVRVEVEDGYFVVGVLFNDSEPSYICYGVPSKSNTQPPQELEDMCVWLPIENDFGYWVIYQSARSGEIIK